MANFKRINKYIINLYTKNNYFFLITLLFSIRIKILNSQCSNSDKIKDGSNCFNRIIKFRSSYRGGQFTIRKDGTLFIEYSSENKRLFYSIKINGRGYFQNEDTNKEITIQSDIYYNNNLIVQRYESKNILIYLSSDISQLNPYIFSISSYNTLSELHHFDNEGNNLQKTWLTADFLNINNKNRYIFSYQFSLFEGNNNIYYAIYIQYCGTSDKGAFSNSYTISKFKFNGLNEREILLTKEFFDNYNNRIISAFIFTHYNYLAVFFLKASLIQYTMRLHDLNTLEQKKEIPFYRITGNANPGEGIFFKAIYLRYEYVAFIFFQDKDNGKSLKLRFLKVLEDNSNFKVEAWLKKEINSYNFDTSIRRNEFYKINNETLLFVSTITQTKLILMFFETYSWYEQINTRTYTFDIEGFKIANDLTVDFYNDFLLFTASVTPTNITASFSSILLFFSYPNGTDFNLNISPFLMDSENYSNSNLIAYLLSTSNIENNIFGYTLINEIKLISIPNEIIFYKEGNNIVIGDGETISSNHVLNQNKNLLKNNQDYILDYQFMALGKGKNIDVFNQAHQKEINFQGNEFESCYSQKKYYGRVNKLKFKLCHDYCETCNELGISNNNQKCKTCLPQYTYDYYIYNNFTNIFPKNCVPEGYFRIIGDNPKLVKCNSSNSKFYYNKTDNNKKICFDKINKCPDSYSFLNESNYECLNYTPPTTIPIIQTTIPLIQTTIPIIQTTIPIILTTMPIIQTTIPIIQTTIPIIQTTIPLIPTTVSIIQTTIPLIQTTLPLIQTIIPIIQTTIPIISTAIQIVQATTEKLETTNIITPTTNPLIQTTLPQMETTIQKNTPINPEISTISPFTYSISILTNIINDLTTTIQKTERITNSPIILNNLSTINLKALTTIITTIPLIKKASTIIYDSTSLEELPQKINNSLIEYNNCLIGLYIIPLCSNITNEQLYSKIKKEIFDSYSNDKSIKTYFGENNLKLRISNTENEMNDINSTNNFSLLDLGECENLLKISNNIPLNIELIILKIKIKNTDFYDYEIYNPITYEKLNLSVCENYIIHLYIPFVLSEDKEKFYLELLKQGYNPFDINDKFYREICTPYKSENGTDVLLEDREEFFYYPLAEQMACQNNCQYSSYSLDTKYIKCECGKNQTFVKLDLKHLSKENLLQSFLSTLRSTNYKVMICYNLVFNFNIFKKNYGSIIILILFLVYILFMICYCIKKIYSLRVKISKILFNDSKNEKRVRNNKKPTNKIIYIKNIKEKLNKNKKNIKKKNKEYNPPKKKNKNKNGISIGSSSTIKTSEQDIAIFTKSSKINLKNNKIFIPKIKNKLVNSQSKTNDKKSMMNLVSNNLIHNSNKKKNKLNIMNIEEEKDLDNFELNALDYEEACDLDKRGFCMMYWSALMREHLFLFTFLSFTDYNLFVIKLERFITLVCIEMSFNGLFFVHESMHRKYINHEEFTFVQKIPQLLFTLIISHIIEVLLCFFGLTDTHIYEIKDLKEREKKGKKVFDIIEKMKNKLVFFFIITFLLFIFNWYFISAFCAVYQNTQIIFLRDTAISFLSSMLDPFLIYGITVSLRYISLMKCSNKKLGCIYKLSDLIPIF